LASMVVTGQRFVESQSGSGGERAADIAAAASSMPG
jgi:hypothetical protein